MAIALVAKSAILRVGLFLLGTVVFVYPPFTQALRDADHWKGRESGWRATDVWLKSAACARQTGAWLVVCDDGRLRPLNDVAASDDPGHAFLLDLYAMASRKPVDVVDVVRLNAFMNLAGLIAVASFLFVCRAYVALIVLWVLGAPEFFGYSTPLPHWGFVGATCLGLLLPLAVLGRERRFLSDRASAIFIAVGLLSLGAVALVREVVGVMVLAVTLGIVGAGLWRGRRDALRDRLALLVLIVAAWLTPHWVLWARDAAFPIEKPVVVQSHGFSHVLYTTLVSTELGIAHTDDIGENAARQAEPGVALYSPEYFRVLWRLYFQLIRQDPGWALQSYVTRARAILADSLLEPAPPLWLSFGLALALIAVTWRRWPLLGAEACRWIGLVSLAFIAFFIVQGTLSLPTRLFSFPAGRLLIVVLACLAEYGARWSWHRLPGKELVAPEP